MNKEQFRPFDRVLIRKSEEKEWHIDIFEKYLENREFPYMCLYSCWKYCIPYEGNEHLLGTTESPKPKRWRAEKGETYWFVMPDCNLCCIEDVYTSVDDAYYNICNYFKTEEEAKAAAEKIKKLLNNERDN